MKKQLLWVIFSATVMLYPVQAISQVDIHFGVNLPPPIAFATSPEVIVLPETNNVYAVPDIADDLYFWNGWWWRLWDGRWYRSQYYDRGWAYYNAVPVFYFDVDPYWRRYYHSRSWYGSPWRYQRIPTHHLHRNWRSWHHSNYWRGQRNWNVHNYRPRTERQMRDLRERRRQEYRPRPDVRMDQQRQFDRRQPDQRRVPPQQFDRRRPDQRQIPPQQFDRRQPDQRRTPPQQFDRRQPDQRRTSPQQLDRRQPDQRQAPTQQINRRPPQQREAPQRQFDRGPSERRTPAQRPDRGGR